MSSHPKNHQPSSSFVKGFSLIELSIVIVIIGLIIGVIVVGKELVSAATNRAVIKEIDFYRHAMHAFRIKYNDIAGDIRDPGKYWSNVTWTATGNGDGWVIWRDEGPIAWKQLNLAGFIGFDPSLSCYTLCHANPGVNIPPSDVVANAGWTIGTNTLVAMRPRNVFMLGAFDGFSIATNPVLSSIMAFDIDTKIDDGKANIGDVTARVGGPPGNPAFCFTAGVYNLSEDIKCAIDVSIGI